MTEDLFQTRKNQFPGFVYILFLCIVFISNACTWNNGSRIKYRNIGNSIIFENTNIHLQIDDNMYFKVGYSDGEKIISIHDLDALDPTGRTPPHFIILNGKAYKNFKIKKQEIENIRDQFFGKGRKLTITGQDSGIEKTMFIDMFDLYPDVALSWCSYKNLSEQMMQINHVYYNYYQLNRKLSSPGSESYSFHYIQPLNEKWGRNWINLSVKDSTHQDFTVPGSGSNHSGVPFIDVWGAELGMSIFHVEGIPRMLHILLNVNKDQKLNVGFETRPVDSYGQFPDKIPPGETITTWKSAVCVHKGDFFNGARRFGQFLDGAMQKEGKEGLIKNYPPQAYEAYWKTWGMNSLEGTRNFTTGQVLNKMNELADYGFKAIMLDDGWQGSLGLWNMNTEKFPGGNSIQNFIREAHTPKWGSGKNKSFKVYLWFDLLGTDTITSVTGPLLVKNKDGSVYKSIQSKYALCPSYPGTINYIKNTLIKRLIVDWDVDGLYTDWEDQNPLPCYEISHHHPYESESLENNYLAFKTMFESTMSIKPGSGWVSQCSCASVHDVYQYPYYFLEDASDPATNKQVRWRVRWIKALRGGTAPAGDGYADKMNYDRKAGEPAQSVAIGAVIMSVRWNVDELGGPEHAKKWMDLFQSEDLCSGEYLGLYDIAYEKPEGYVIRKSNGTLYYSFFDEQPFDKKIELRGLVPGIKYKMTDYENRISLGNIEASSPVINITSKTGNGMGDSLFYYVLKCVPEIDDVK